MTSRKKELEIIYNLEWKNKPANGDEKSNMVGILDIPATTLDWKTFKSYLLKNSGAADDNVKVSYIDSEEREKPINSQLDFEIALYTFRHKARMNEIITLKLDCINSKKGGTNGVKGIAKGLSDVQVKMKPKIKKAEEPPEWFLTYMKKFKEEIVEEISAIYSSKTHQMNMSHARKLKADSYKRTRKSLLLLGDANNDKQLSNTAKMERKLESKLEKLEHKTMKIKAKKMALRGSSDSDVGRSSGKNETSTYLFPNTSNDLLVNASVIKQEGTPHMIGGEQYCKTWDISNTGTLPWTKETELRYAWGSQALKPLNKEVPCPPLLPGEKGTICVFLEIPKMPGTYECYWHFYHNGRRFGHWLGCDIIVDEPPIKNIPFIPSPTYDVINIQDGYELVLPTSWTMPKKTDETDTKAEDFVNPFSDNENSFFQTMFDKNATFNPQQERNKDEESKDFLDGKVNILQQGTKGDMNAFSDSDNQSIVSISDSSVNSATSEDFVMLKMNASPKLETEPPQEFSNLTKMNVSSLENIENLFTKLNVDNLSVDGAGDIDTTDLKVDHVVPVKMEEVAENVLENTANTGPMDLSNKSIEKGDKALDNNGYAYVYYKGRKIPISKKHLSEEFLVTAESVPESEVKKLEGFNIDEIMQKEMEEFVANVNECQPRTSTPSTADVQQDNKSEEYNHPVNLCCSMSAAGNECLGSCGLGTSMTSSTNEHRFFVFPQFYPGYEVVPPIGTGYIDPNGANTIPFQPVYRYNTVGEVLVNDWSTGLNYTACGRCPIPSNQYYNSANTSRGCSSIPNSNSETPLPQSPQSPKENCSCKGEDANTFTPRNRCRMADSTKAETFEDLHQHVCDGISSENPQSHAGNQTNNSRGNNSKTGVPDLLSGATVVATSAINTARSVLNMFVPPRSTDCGRWQNGHWISTNAESKREKNLRLLYEMGFYNRDLNATLLGRYSDDINAVVSELLQ